MNWFVRLFIAIAMMVSNVAFASDGKSLAEKQVSGTYVSLEAAYHRSRDTRVTPNFLGKTLYAEKEIGNGLLVFTQVYHDPEFSSVFVGVSRKFGDFQVGLAVGPSWYDGRRWNTVNPWLYYGKDGIEGSLYAEAYKGDPVRFYKGHLQNTFSNGIIAGVYGESFAGVGPMVGYQFTEHLSVRVMVPVTVRPDEGGAKVLVFLKYTMGD